MAETFPSSLQEKLNTAGFTTSFGNTLIRSSMDTGLDKVRSRYTKGIDTFSCTIDLEFDDYDTLSIFYKTTLSNGSKTFNYDHPFYLTAAEFRFKAPPTITPMGGRYFRVSMSWEQIP